MLKTQRVQGQDNYFPKTQCSALLDSGRPCGKKMDKSDAFRDVLGFYWCPVHQDRGWLLNWAAAHNYPKIRCGRFAIGNGQHAECWTIPMLIGHEEMIQEAMKELRPNEEVA
jgi:hypothetical protein